MRRRRLKISDIEHYTVFRATLCRELDLLTSENTLNTAMRVRA